NPGVAQGAGIIDPYFTDGTFEKDETGAFYSKENECLWPSSKNKLHFFAYYPSVASMKETCGIQYFNLANNTKRLDVGVNLDFRLEKFVVAREIADQADFLTAYSSGSLEDNGGTGIALDFKHQLARIELSAWGNNDKNDFDIAGVRIGNPLTLGDFNFSVLPRAEIAPASPWMNTSGIHSAVEHIFSAGETVVRLSKAAGSHLSENDAVSLMGTAGPAMLIPMSTRIEAWEGINDPAIADADYSTDKMYFSVLMRVKNTDNQVVYPYPVNSDNMNVEYFAIDRYGKIVERLYLIDGEYYTTPESSADLRYIPDATVEICRFGWAALPVAAKWEAGKIYTYKLNYSNGIGWHDPEDPSPGEPIIERGKIPFEVSVQEWIPAEDYNPDINVPKR
nr:fimbrillin family protein [Muribaculaceae bacterium]